MRTCNTVLVGLALLTYCPAARAAVPSNGWVVWASTRTGNREIHLMKADGTGIARLTHGGGEWPAWSPDGKWIGYTRNGASRVVHPDPNPDTNGDKKVCDGRFLFWMHDGSGLVCDVGSTFYLVNPDTGAKNVLFKKSDYPNTMNRIGGGENFRPIGITHDGKYILFMGSYDGKFALANGTFPSGFAALAQHRYNESELYLIGYGCEPDAPPAGDFIYHVCGDQGPCATYPDIYRMNINELAKAPTARTSYQPEVAYADAEWGHEYFPRVSNDNKWLVYGATTGDHPHATSNYEIFVHRLGSGSTSRQQITDDPNNKINNTWPDLYVGNLWQPPRPALALSPPVLSFAAQQGQTPKTAAKQVAVSNTGAGTLGTVSTSVAYGSGSGWLQVDVSGSGNSQTLSTQLVNVAGLTPSTYTATVQVSESSASNSPQSYTVSLTITSEAQPVLALSPIALTVNAVAGSGEPEPQTIAVANPGSGILNSIATSISYTGPNTGWLDQVERRGSGNTQFLDNSFVSAGLEPNTYSATVEVVASGAANSPQNYTITLIVAPGGGVDDAGVGSDAGTIANDGGADTVPVTPSNSPSHRGLVLEGGCRVGHSGRVAETPTSVLLALLVLALAVLRRKASHG